MVDERFEYTKQKLAEGVSQRQIARELQVDHTTIAYWIRNDFSTGLRNANGLSEKEIVEFCNKNSVAYAYILGSYLGDGHIIKMPRTYKLRIYNNANDNNVISDQVNALITLFPQNKVSTLKRTKSNCIEVGVYSNILPELFPQHGTGKKHDRDVSLKDWQWDIVWEEPESFIKGLIDSDGSYYVYQDNDTPTMRYQFTNKSLDIVDMYIKVMAHMGISTRPTQKQCGVFNIFTNKKQDIEKLDKLYEIAENKLRS